MESSSSPDRSTGGAEPASPRLTQHRPARLLWLLGGSLLVLGAARLIPYSPVTLPPCGLRTLTGIPCPLCGSTRALIAFSHFNLADAFRFNPLVAAVCLFFFAWLVLSSVDCWLGRNQTARLWQRLQRKPWLILLVAGLLANWIYLMFHLPK